LIVLSRVERGRMTPREAARILSFSLRQVKRILAAYRKEDATALAHGNRRRKPRHTLDAWMKRKALELFQRIYKVGNHQHFGLLLEEINLSCSSVRHIVLKAAIRNPRKTEKGSKTSQPEKMLPQRSNRG